MVFHDADALLQVRYEAAVSRKESAKMSVKRERRAGYRQQTEVFEKAIKPLR